MIPLVSSFVWSYSLRFLECRNCAARHHDPIAYSISMWVVIAEPCLCPSALRVNDGIDEILLTAHGHYSVIIHRPWKADRSVQHLFVQRRNAEETDHQMLPRMGFLSSYNSRD